MRGQNGRTGGLISFSVGWWLVHPVFMVLVLRNQHLHQDGPAQRRKQRDWHRNRTNL